MYILYLFFLSLIYIFTVSLLDWEILSTVDIFEAGELSLSPQTSVESAVRNKLEEDEQIDVNAPSLQKEKLRQALKERHKRTKQKEELLRTTCIKNIKKMMKIDTSALSRIHSILMSLRRLDSNQNGLAGDGSDCKNMWIVKPAAKSRGLFICFIYLSSFSFLSRYLLPLILLLIHLFDKSIVCSSLYRPRHHVL